MLRLLYLTCFGFSLFMGSINYEMMNDSHIIAKVGCIIVFGGFAAMSIWGIIKNGDFS